MKGCVRSLRGNNQNIFDSVLPDLVDNNVRRGRAGMGLLRASAMQWSPRGLSGILRGKRRVNGLSHGIHL